MEYANAAATQPEGFVRHIVVEGCDGSGKTTLIKYISKLWSMPVHPKASTSVGGPVDDLDKWVENEFHRAKQPGIYDRHPIISETIYGPVIRGTVPGLFNDAEWLTTCAHRLARECVVIWCAPPWTAVHNNVMKTTQIQMPGVIENMYQLYRAYETRRKAWRGPSVEYDYTRTEALREFHIALAYTKAKECCQ